MRRPRWAASRLALALLALASVIPATGTLAAERDGYLVTSDGVRLHYLDAGPDPSAASLPGTAAVAGRIPAAAASPLGPALLFVPGWTMPAWIWQPQIDALSRRYRVIAMDPRGQGGSEVALSGYDQERRGRDIADMITRLLPQPVVLVGWSLGVLDSLAYVHQYGDAALAGMVLVDNSVGEEPAPLPSRAPPTPGSRRPVPREVFMQGFVRSMFHRPQPELYLDRLTETALRTPKFAADRLLRYPVPRTYWREALYSVRRPVLYAITPKWSAQAANVAANDPYAEVVTFPGAGHALFVDEASRFNAVLDDFIRRRIRP